MTNPTTHPENYNAEVPPSMPLSTTEELAFLRAAFGEMQKMLNYLAHSVRKESAPEPNNERSEDHHAGDGLDACLRNEPWVLNETLNIPERRRSRSHRGREERRTEEERSRSRQREDSSHRERRTVDLDDIAGIIQREIKRQRRRRSPRLRT